MQKHPIRYLSKEMAYTNIYWWGLVCRYDSENNALALIYYSWLRRCNKMNYYSVKSPDHWDCRNHWSVQPIHCTESTHSLFQIRLRYKNRFDEFAYPRCCCIFRWKKNCVDFFYQKEKHQDYSRWHFGYFLYAIHWYW